MGDSPNRYLTIREAARQGIRRVRIESWVDQDAYFLIDIDADGRPGSWIHLFSDENAAIGAENPQSILWVVSDHWNQRCYVPYECETTMDEVAFGRRRAYLDIPQDG